MTTIGFSTVYNAECFQLLKTIEIRQPLMVHTTITGQATMFSQRWFCDNAPYGECPTCGVKFCSNHAKHSFDSPWPVAKFGNQLPNKIWPCGFCYDRQKKERFPNSSRAQFDEYLLNTLGKRNITKHRSVSTKVQSKSNLSPSSNVPESKAPSVIGLAARIISLPILIIGGIFWLGSSDHKKGGPP